MKRLRLAAAALGLAVLAGCGSGGVSGGSSLAQSLRDMTATTDTSGGTGALQGTVRRADGSTVSGAAVTVRPAGGGGMMSFTTASNADGSFAVGHMPPGQYMVTADEPGVGSMSFTAMVSAGAVTSQGNCDLPPGHGVGGGAMGDPVSDTTGLIVGDVVDSAGAPVAGASVSAGEGIVGRTNRNGLFALGGLTPGSYTVTVQAFRYADASQSATVVAGTSILLQFTLQAGTGSGSAAPATINVTVTDATTTSPIAGASLVLGSAAAVVTGADGSYAFTNVRAGGYRLRISADGYRSQVLPLMVEPGATVAVPVALAPATSVESGTGTLAVTVTDSSSGGPVSPAMVQIDDLRPFYVDANGQATVTDVPAGDHNIVVGARGYAAQHGTVTIAADSTTSYNVSLTPRAAHDPANAGDGGLTPGPHGHGGPH